MFKKTVAYTNLNGQAKTKDLYFHFFESEILEMEMSEKGGFAETVQGIIDAEDHPTLLRIVKDFVLKAYGTKSPDGEQFIKSEEQSTNFSQTPAFSALFMELTTNDEAAAEFVNALIPESMKKDLADKIKKPGTDSTPTLAPVN